MASQQPRGTSFSHPVPRSPHWQSGGHRSASPRGSREAESAPTKRSAGPGEWHTHGARRHRVPDLPARREPTWP